MKRQNEFLVGVITILAFLLLVVITLNLKGLALWGKQWTFDVFFRTIKGLEVGAPVHVYGYIAGEVKKIEYTGGMCPNQVTIGIKKDIILYRNAKVRIATAGLIGETRVEIEAGTPDAGILEPGEQIIGVELLDIYQVLSLTPAIVEDISEIIGSFRELIATEENREALANSFQRLDSITANLEALLSESSTDIKETFAELREATEKTTSLLEDLDSLIVRVDQNVANASQDITQYIENLKESSGEVSERTTTLLDRLNRSAEDLSQFLETNEQNITETTRNLRESSQSLQRLFSQVEEGEGTLGLLISDPSPFIRLKDLIDALYYSLYGTTMPSYPTVIGYGSEMTSPTLRGYAE